VTDASVHDSRKFGGLLNKANPYCEVRGRGRNGRQFRKHVSLSRVLAFRKNKRELSEKKTPLKKVYYFLIGNTALIT
jgi:hypothetical protein